MKRCPFCAQAIQDDVVTCPLCHMNVAAGPAAPPPPPPIYGQQVPVQPGNPGGAYPYAAGQAETSGKATGSLIAGIAAYVIAPFVGAIVAVVLGHLGLSEIKKSAGRLKGDGMAIAGLVLGYLQIAVIPFILIIAAIAIPNLIKSKMAANEASAVGSLRTITTAEISYATACPRIGYAYALSELGPSATVCPEGANQIDEALASGLRNGYRFTPNHGNFSGHAPEDAFGWSADPVSNATGTRHFFVDQTGVIRYSTTGPADADSTPLR